MPQVLEDRTTLESVVELAAAGKIRPSVEKVLPLSDFAKAQDMSQTGHARGKTVLVF
jgi:NADPH:quinone reductase-like Zn-dependent oxidoreductase